MSSSDRPAPQPAAPPAHELACVMHVHSTYSDGTAAVPEILAAARAARADAVLLTDHDTLGARRDGWEGWHDGVLLVVGVEVTPRRGHYLAFGLDEEIGHAGRSEAEIAGAVRAAGGLGFPAHAFSAGSRMSRTIAPPHGWSDLDSDSHTGIEVWSLLTEGPESWRSPREAWRFMVHPERAIDHPPPGNLAAWDRLCARRRVVGIAGLDAHQPGLRLGAAGRVLSPLPHARWFAWLRTHVLCDGPPAGADELLAALATGRCFMAVDHWADSRGFRFWAQEPHSGTVPMGGELGGSGDGSALRALLPREADLSLLRDGVPVRRERGARTLEHPISGPGAWRLEAHLAANGRDRTWIVSNPIYVR